MNISSINIGNSSRRSTSSTANNKQQTKCVHTQNSHFDSIYCAYAVVCACSRYVLRSLAASTFHSMCTEFERAHTKTARFECIAKKVSQQRAHTHKYTHTDTETETRSERRFGWTCNAFSIKIWVSQTHVTCTRLMLFTNAFATLAHSPVHRFAHFYSGTVLQKLLHLPFRLYPAPFFTRSCMHQKYR